MNFCFWYLGYLWQSFDHGNIYMCILGQTHVFRICLEEKGLDKRVFLFKQNCGKLIGSFFPEKTKKKHRTFDWMEEEWLTDDVLRVRILVSSPCIQTWWLARTPFHHERSFPFGGRGVSDFSSAPIL